MMHVAVMNECPLMEHEKVICRTPTPGKKPTRIDAKKFETVRRAILAVVPPKGQGLLFTDLTPRVAAKLNTAQKSQFGSLMWYVTTVKLEMEVRGEIQRVRGISPQRLKRPGSTGSPRSRTATKKA